MPTATTRTFRSGNGDAVRFPKHMSPGAGVDVTIEQSGDVFTIYPTRKQSVAEMVARLIELGPPEPGKVQDRDPIEWPERPGL